MEHESAKAPGLKWRARAGGPPVPYWVASPAAIRAGFDLKTINLSSEAPEDIQARCATLQAEMLEWIGRSRPARFDGTLGSLLAVYETHEDSSYHALKPGSMQPY